jgi:site-specific DNA-methyltransferase (cytosine-N4-specific)
MQLDLISDVLGAYRAAERPLNNDALYSAVAQRAALPLDVTERSEPIGKTMQPRNIYKRSVRWYQQTLKTMGLIERTDKRGMWALTAKGRKGLHPIQRPLCALAFSTKYGVGIWGHAEDVLGKLDQEVTLCVTSPPYPLSSGRAYGNPDQRQIVNFICESLVPVIKRMTPEASLVLNLSNDIFVPCSPGRSTYLERLTIALEDRYGLGLMGRLVWFNNSKPPGPIRYASGTRQQLNVAWEPVLWFAKDPQKCKSNNRRVLLPHSERQLALIKQGGEQREAEYGDGAYRIVPGNFGKTTEGRIPKNAIPMGHACPHTRKYRRAMKAANLPSHGAGFPYALPKFLIEFLTEPGDLVIDLFGGRSMPGRAAEDLGRRWVTIECMLEYAVGGASLFGVQDDLDVRIPLM